MSWQVITRDKIDLSAYNVLPFGRFNLAEPFVRALLDSDDTISDLVKLDASAVASLRRALCKVAGVKFIERDTGKVTKSGKAIIAKTVNANLVNEALDRLHLTLEVLATSTEDGVSRDFVQLRKVA